MQKQLKKRLNSTLGTRTELAPTCSLPNNVPSMSAQQVARAVMASMVAAQPNAGNVSDFYAQRVEATMCMYHELQASDTVYKYLMDNVQNGALMIFCNDVLWASVPPLWKDIEATKTESDLRRILEKEWNKNSMNINIQYYRIHWSDNLLIAIRKVEFTKSGGKRSSHRS